MKEFWLLPNMRILSNKTRFLVSLATQLSKDF